MSKLFISYRRRSWPFTHRLADELRKHLNAEIFVDLTGIDEDNFENSILRNLRDSDAMLLVVSEHTFTDRIHRDDDWVRREIREALEHTIPIVLVCVEGLLPPAGLPEDISAVSRKQGINFYPDYFSPAVKQLAEFVVKIGAADMRVSSPKRKPVPAQLASADDVSETKLGGRETFNQALGLLEAGDYAKALFLLEALKSQGYKPRFVDIDELITQAEEQKTRDDSRHRAAIEYEEIAVLARTRITEAQAQAAWEGWCMEHAEWIDTLDVHKLASRFKRTSGAEALLPALFEWVAIPAGRVRLEEGGYLKQATDFDVPAFAIAKYPITNAQYAKFVEAGGYNERKWWTGEGWKACEEGWHYDGEWKSSGKPWTEPRYWQDPDWNQPDHPVVGVSWYEAVAFCNWLAAETGERIRLPAEQEWQRAAQGDDGRKYPWGNQAPNENFCNWNRNIGRTTPVTKYPAGASPFGVLGMSGNVWEWCQTGWDTGTNELGGKEPRMLRGGSWFDNDPAGLRAAYRGGGDPSNGIGDWGFRVSRL